MTTDTTSAGMPPIAPSHDALDVVPVQATDIRSPFTSKVLSFADEGKAQVTGTLDGLASTVRDFADKLDANGAAPFAGFVHQAADTVAGWSSAVDGRSVDDLIDDTRTLVRTSPAVAVGLSIVAGFVLARLVKASTTGTAQ
ncbi:MULTISPECIES: hypothetical protein [Sphingosinicellaceae]|uniref:hypothetical protein n=1 Tax=Sphingosinicellaceae TaxID=2820280 RepID=UPI001C1DE958|nr:MULTISPECIES: hypothetical protein [Polymorphobacter]QYE34236.1 hypothetical protein KZX46_15825 [Polymorphobacter sp. PAMC 29334]UAJ09415.1 hypothetical protein KTC28_14010 [Polymorphobacter megasporae]